MKLITLLGTYFMVNVVLSIKLNTRANEQYESKLTNLETPNRLLNTNHTLAELNNTSNLNQTLSNNLKIEDHIDPEKLEIPKITRSNTDIFMRDPIKSLNININNFNNINDPSLNSGLNLNKISSIQNELLNRLKDNIKLNSLNADESKKVIVTSKKVPVVKKENNDNPYLTWEN